MKTLFVLLLAISSQFVMGQRGNEDQHVPQNVRHSFQREYPQAADVRWSNTGNEWRANFTDRSPQDRGEMFAHYHHDGRHIDSHIPYDRNDVPSPVVRHIEKRWPESRDQFYTRIERPGSRPLFQVSMTVHGKRTNRYVDDEGRDKEYQDRH